MDITVLKTERTLSSGWVYRPRWIRWHTSVAHSTVQQLKLPSLKCSGFMLENNIQCKVSVHKYHWMTGSFRLEGPLELCSSLLLQAGPAVTSDLVAQDVVHFRLENLEGQTTSLGNLYPFLAVLRIKRFLMFSWKLSCFNFCCLLSFSTSVERAHFSTDHLGTTLWQVSFTLLWVTLQTAVSF